MKDDPQGGSASARCAQHGLTYDPAVGCVLCNARGMAATPSSGGRSSSRSAVPKGVSGVEPKSAVTALILYFITCGLYEIFGWMPYRVRAVNALLGRQEYEYIKILLLSIVTFGIMYMYYEYQMATSIVEIKKDRGLHATESLPLVTVLFDLFGLSFVSSFMHQEELNKLV